MKLVVVLSPAAVNPLPLAVLLVGAIAASAAGQPPPPLTTAGEKLKAAYAAEMLRLKGEIEKSVPALDPGKKKAYETAIAAEKVVAARVAAAQQACDEIPAAYALVGHATGKWIGGAERGIATAQEMMKKATSDNERDAAQKELAKWQADLAAGKQALQERQAQLEKVLAEKPVRDRELQAAQETLGRAKESTSHSLDDLGLGPFLASPDRDSQLAKYVILHEATPRGLAMFAQQGREQEALIGRLLTDDSLMKQVVIADGAAGGNYGRAMEIYTTIQNGSPASADGVLQRLALAIALEHAVPIKQDNPAAATAAPATVDPVNRYRAYEKAYRDGELDPAFEDLTTWDLRFVVNGDEPDDVAAWGREMLRNYRPDLIANPDRAWRYVQAVATEVRYGSQDCKFDRPDLQHYQNIIMNGGICGRRAFFGRFILRSFGIPTTARPQRGHGALVHWTPDGWVVNFGGGWGSGWTMTRYKGDLDFLATTQARTAGEPFLQVKRAQWIGDAVGEKAIYGFSCGEPGLWYGISLYRQRAIAEKAKTLAAVGEDLAEANESKTKETVATQAISDADKRIVVATDGSITIPAAACRTPTASTEKIRFMPSDLGGLQLHYGRTGGPQPFEYAFDCPGGRYALTARVVTTSDKQRLQVAANGAGQPIDIALPFTIGMWGVTPPVEVTLTNGPNTLRFSREEPVKGVTIKDFILTPLK